MKSVFFNLNERLMNVIQNKDNAHLDNVIEELNEYCLTTFNLDINALYNDFQLLNIDYPLLEQTIEILNNYFN